MLTIDNFFKSANIQIATVKIKCAQGKQILKDRQVIVLF